MPQQHSRIKPTYSWISTYTQQYAEAMVTKGVVPRGIRFIDRKPYKFIKSWKQAHALQRSLLKKYKSYLQSNRSLEGTEWLDILLEIKPGNLYAFSKEQVGVRRISLRCPATQSKADFCQEIHRKYNQPAVMLELDGTIRLTVPRYATILHIARVQN